MKTQRDRDQKKLGEGVNEWEEDQEVAAALKQLKNMTWVNNIIIKANKLTSTKSRQIIKYGDTSLAVGDGRSRSGWSAGGTWGAGSILFSFFYIIFYLLNNI